MGYEVSWLVNNRVLYIKPVGNVTVADMESAIVTMQDMMDLGESPIHTISDNRFVGEFPNSLSTLKKLMSRHEKATGWSLLIQENAAARFVGEMLTRFAGQNKLKSFTNLHDTLAFLERNDTSLRAIPNPEE